MAWSVEDHQHHNIQLENAHLNRQQKAGRLGPTPVHGNGVGVSTPEDSYCTVPAAGKPTFSIGDDEMEIGMGIHGEPGVRRGKLESADQIACTLTNTILADLPLAKGDEDAVLVNGLGGTPQEEL